MTTGWHRRGPTDANRIRGRAGQAMRQRILHRDHYACVECANVGKVTRAVIVDHIVSLAKGGSNEDANQASLCGEHAKAKDIADGVHRGKGKVTIGLDGWPAV